MIIYWFPKYEIMNEKYPLTTHTLVLFGNSKLVISVCF